MFLAVLLGLLAFRGYGSSFGARPTELVAADLTDLNAADRSQLAQVPGIGPKMAEAIVDHRRVYGPFQSVDELKAVRGVGAVTFEKVRPHVRAGAVEAPPVAPDLAGASGEITSTSFSSPVARPLAAVPKPVPAGAKKIQPGEPPIDVNTAPAAELQRLPGVGPVMAEAIVAARTAAPFRAVSDLDKVKGIGPKKLDALRPFVVVR